LIDLQPNERIDEYKEHEKEDDIEELLVCSLDYFYDDLEVVESPEELDCSQDSQGFESL